MPEAGNPTTDSSVAETNQSSTGRRRPTVYHIPVCPFSQRLEILLTLKGY